MEKCSFLLHAFLQVVDRSLQLWLRKAVQGRLLKYTVHIPVRPLLRDVYSLPAHPSLKVPLLALLLIDDRPAKVGADNIFVAPAIEGVDHCTFTTAKLQYPCIGVDKLGEEVFEQRRLNVPVVYLLLFKLVACVPVAFNIVVGQIFGETVFDKKLFVLAQFGQLHFLLHP